MASFPTIYFSVLPLNVFQFLFHFYVSFFFSELFLIILEYQALACEIHCKVSLVDFTSPKHQMILIILRGCPFYRQLLGFLGVKTYAFLWKAISTVRIRSSQEVGTGGIVHSRWWCLGSGIHWGNFKGQKWQTHILLIGIVFGKYYFSPLHMHMNV